MLALFGGLAGFFSSLIPELINFFKESKDKQHELNLINLQIKALRFNRTSRLEEVQIKASAEESKYLYNYASSPTKVKWIDALSASVRPMITYTLFALYIYLKISSFAEIRSMAVIWTNEDEGIFCAVIGFWFGHVAFSKNRLSNSGGSY